MWIEGFSGSGKSSIANKIKIKFEKKFGKTLVLSGDDLRMIFNLYGYEKKDRILNSYKFSNYIYFLIKNKINVIYTVVGLNNKARKIYKSKLKNFYVTLIDSDVNKIIKLGKKKTYLGKKNILGIDITPEYPKKPDFIIKNDMKKKLNKLATYYINEIIDKLYK